MATKSNQSESAYAHARQLIEQGHVVQDERAAWSEHQPSAHDENRFIEDQGINAYAKWFLGIDESEPEGSKARYTFPYGDLVRVHRGGVLAAEVRAGQYKHADIGRAAAHLHGMLDAVMWSSS